MGFLVSGFSVPGSIGGDGGLEPTDYKNNDKK